MSDQDTTDDEPGEGETGPPSDAEPAEREKSLSKAVEKPRKASASKASRAAKSSHRSTNDDEKRAGKLSADSKVAVSRAVIGAVVALTAGALGGWFGHDAQAKARLRAESASAPAGSGSASGPCGAWEQKICASGGVQSAACQQAKAATGLLMPSTCEVALEAVPATLAKVKAGRASCETLVTKLCKDLPQGSATCQMVKERTSSFPGERCAEMLKNYDKVIGEVRTIDQQNAMQMGGPSGGAPPPGMPPGPQGSPHQ